MEPSRTITHEAPMPQSARESLIRKFLLLCGLPLALANADVVVNTFEVGADSLLYCDSWASDSSKAVLSLDSAHPIDGRASARLDYVLDPNVTQYPWVGAFSSFRGLADLRTATGIRIKLHSEVDNRLIELIPASNWYPLPHANRSVTWQCVSGHPKVIRLWTLESDSPGDRRES